MKELIISLVVITISGAAFCQDTSVGKMKDTSMNKMHHMMKDCVMMKDGKVKQWKAGQITTVSSPVMLTNGATVASDGTVKMKDGTTTMLKDGQYIDMDGNIGTMKDHANKQMP
jgi:hypothetical protein